MTPLESIHFFQKDQIKATFVVSVSGSFLLSKQRLPKSSFHLILTLPSHQITVQT